MLRSSREVGPEQREREAKTRWNGAGLWLCISFFKGGFLLCLPCFCRSEPLRGRGLTPLNRLTAALWCIDASLVCLERHFGYYGE